MRLAALLLAGMFLLTGGVQAQGKWSIQVTLRSFHFDRSQDLNEWNLGVGIGRDVGPVDVEVGGYYNSKKRLSLYATPTIVGPEDSVIRAGMALGLVTGYKRIVTPMLIVGTEIGHNPALRLNLIPGGGGLITSQITYTP